MSTIDDLEHGPSVAEYGTRLLELPNGSCWFDLHRHWCPIEGEIMDHDGNEFGQHTHNLYSLRTPDPDHKGQWFSLLTATVEAATNTLICVSGYGAEKPDEAHHSELVALLKLDCIKDLNIDDESDSFVLSDLEDSTRHALCREKPQLFYAYDQYCAFGEINSTVIEQLKRELGNQFKTLNQDGQTQYAIQLNRGDDIKELATRYSLDNLSNYAETLVDGFIECFDAQIDHHDDDIKTALSTLYTEPAQAKTVSQLKRYLITHYSETLEEENWDIDSPDTVYNLYEYHNDHLLMDTFNRTVQAGEDAGTNDQLFDAYRKMLENSADFIEGAWFEQESPDSQWTLYISPQGLFHVIKTCLEEDWVELDYSQKNLDDIANYYIHEMDGLDGLEDLEIPYYGFNDWNQDAAAEMLQEILAEELEEEMSNNPFYDIKPVSEAPDLQSNQSNHDHSSTLSA